MQFKIILIMLKREFWEHKLGFIFVPTVVTGMLLVLLLAGVYWSENFTDKVHSDNSSDASRSTGQLIEMEQSFRRGLYVNDKNISFNELNFTTLAKDHPELFVKLVMGMVYANTAILALVYFIVMLIYGHACLFDDRRNRDILFWRSMPVSETSNVLVKLGMLLMLAPFATLALNIMLALASFIICIIFFSYHGASLAAIMLSIANVDIPGKIIILFSQSLLTQLLLIPFFGFILFCSALAKKSPVFISSVIPVMLIVIDKILQSTSPINLKVIDTLDIYWRAFNRLLASFQVEPNSISISNTYMTFVAALVVGMAFVVASIWLRNNRYEL